VTPPTIFRRPANDNAFAAACLVERRGMAALLPYLETRAWRGPVIQVAKGPLA
jgi:hypothetical protein